MPEGRCKIILRGQIDPRWAHWFDEMEVTHLPSNQTQLTGMVIDDAAFNGLISKIRDLGLSILYAEREDNHNDKNDETKKE